MDVVIRPVEPRDVRLVQRIEESIYPDPWPRALFQLISETAPGFFVVAVFDEKVIGYAIGEVKIRGGSLAGHVMNIAVDHPWRRKGVGQALLEELETRLNKRGVAFFFLEVRESNLQAQYLYTKNNYMVVGRLPRYYRDEDGLVMEKRINRIR